MLAGKRTVKYLKIETSNWNYLIRFILIHPFYFNSLLGWMTIFCQVLFYFPIIWSECLSRTVFVSGLILWKHSNHLVLINCCLNWNWPYIKKTLKILENSNIKYSTLSISMMICDRYPFQWVLIKTPWSYIFFKHKILVIHMYICIIIWHDFWI